MGLLLRKANLTNEKKNIVVVFYYLFIDETNKKKSKYSKSFIHSRILSYKRENKKKNEKIIWKTPEKKNHPNTNTHTQTKENHPKSPSRKFFKKEMKHIELG